MAKEEEYEEEPSGTATGNDKKDQESAKAEKKKREKGNRENKCLGSIG